MRVNPVTRFRAYVIACCQWQYSRRRLLQKIARQFSAIISLHDTIALLTVILLLAGLLKKTTEEEQRLWQSIDMRTIESSEATPLASESSSW